MGNTLGSRHHLPCYVSALSSEPIPLHGIQYFEIRIRTPTSNPSLPQNLLKQVFVGLCCLEKGSKQVGDKSFEDSHRWKSSLLLNCYDSSFWGNGQQLQVFSNKFIKISQPIKNKDVIRVAIDLRLAWQFQNILKESRTTLSQAGLNEDFGLESRGLNPISIRERLRDRVLRDGVRGSESQYSNLDQAMQRFNMFLTSHNEMMMFNSPCKLRFGFNQSEFHEGADLHLLQMMLQASHQSI